MGFPMAGHLVRAGHEVFVWNRTPGKTVAGAALANSLEDLGRECDVVMICVNRCEDVDEVLTGLLKRLRPGSLVIDHSTIAPDAAAGFQAALADRGMRFVDAPITGGSMGAQNGTLTIFCGGEEADVEAAMPYLQAYGKRVERVGGPGKGQMMKMANQIAVGGALLALCECLAFASKAGLDMVQAKTLIGGGAAGSWAVNVGGLPRNPRAGAGRSGLKWRGFRGKPTTRTKRVRRNVGRECGRVAPQPANGA